MDDGSESCWETPVACPECGRTVIVVCADETVTPLIIVRIPTEVAFADPPRGRADPRRALMVGHLRQGQHMLAVRRVGAPSR
jgi:hypothetical protein